jgi:hypothetical protein
MLVHLGMKLRLEGEAAYELDGGEGSEGSVCVWGGWSGVMRR